MHHGSHVVKHGGLTFPSNGAKQIRPLPFFVREKEFLKLYGLALSQGASHADSEVHECSDMC